MVGLLVNLSLDLNNQLILSIASSLGLDRFGSLITSPIITLILTCTIFLCTVYQLYSRQFNVAGIISVIATLIFFIGYVSADKISMVSVLLFSIGIVLLIIELFVVGAILGILGFVSIVTSFLLVGNNFFDMGLIIAIALLLTMVEWVILVKGFNRKIPFFEKVILRDSTNKESGYTSHDDRSHLVSKEGITMTALRPSGIIVVEDERIDAVSDGSFIQKDQQVRIIKVEGTRVVVRKI